MPVDSPGREADSRLPEILAPLLGDPEGTAILCDVDGTLAPIVERSDEARVPEAARRLLATLGTTYGLVGCVSGRPAADARHMVGVGSLSYVGNHGFEQLWPGDERPRLDPALEGHEEDASRFAGRFDNPELRSLRLRIEDKGPIFAFHWRGAPDEDAAEAKAHELAAEAKAEGLVVHWGRKVLEIRPPVSLDKGTGIAGLLGERGLRRALYGGDDRTDLDAFRRLREMSQAGALDTAICVAVASEEGPAELTADADLVVDGPQEFLTLLRRLVREAD